MCGTLCALEFLYFHWLQAVPIFFHNLVNKSHVTLLLMSFLYLERSCEKSTKESVKKISWCGYAVFIEIWGMLRNLRQYGAARWSRWSTEVVAELPGRRRNTPWFENIVVTEDIMLQSFYQSWGTPRLCYVVTLRFLRRRRVTRVFTSFCFRAKSNLLVHS